MDEESNRDKVEASDSDDEKIHTTSGSNGRTKDDSDDDDDKIRGVHKNRAAEKDTDMDDIFGANDLDDNDDDDIDYKKKKSRDDDMDDDLDDSYRGSGSKKNNRKDIDDDDDDDGEMHDTDDDDKNNKSQNDAGLEKSVDSEDEAPKEKVTLQDEVLLDPVTKYSAGEAFTIRMPIYVRSQKLPFDESKYNPAQDAKSGNNVINYLRWRYKKNEQGEILLGDDGKPLRQSNSRIVKFSDGTYNVIIGDAIFNVDTATAPSDKSYVFSRQKNFLKPSEGSDATGAANKLLNPSVLECLGLSTGSLHLKQSSLTRATHEKRVDSIKAISNALATTADDNDTSAFDLQTMDKNLQRDYAFNRVGSVVAKGRHSSSNKSRYLDSGDEFSDDPNSTSIAAIKRQTKKPSSSQDQGRDRAGGRGGRQGRFGRDDESLGSRSDDSRGEEEDDEELDDFIVDDEDEEVGSGEDEDSGPERSDDSDGIDEEMIKLARKYEDKNKKSKKADKKSKKVDKKDKKKGKKGGDKKKGKKSKKDSDDDDDDDDDEVDEEDEEESVGGKSEEMDDEEENPFGRKVSGVLPVFADKSEKTSEESGAVAAEASQEKPERVTSTSSASSKKDKEKDKEGSSSLKRKASDDGEKTEKSSSKAGKAGKSAEDIARELEEELKQKRSKRVIEDSD
jgi:RNA polymerase-associated protein LEO1